VVGNRYGPKDPRGALLDVWRLRLTITFVIHCKIGANDARVGHDQGMLCYKITCSYRQYSIIRIHFKCTVRTGKLTLDRLLNHTDSPFFRICLRGFIRRKRKRVANKTSRIKDMTSRVCYLVAVILIRKYKLLCKHEKN